MNAKIRNWLMPIHRWAGLTIGLVIITLGTTGALMMFRPQIEPIIDRDIQSVSACQGRGSIDQMTKVALAAHPHGQIDFIRVPALAPEAGRMATPWIRFVDKDTYYFNPCTGALLGEQNRYTGLFGTIERIHRFRFMPKGGLVAGTSALGFALILVIGGVLLWLPPKLRGLRRAATYKSGLKGPAARLNLHRVLGLYVAPIVILSALTGPTQSFAWYKGLVYAVAGSSMETDAYKSSPANGRSRLPLQAYLDRALTLSPSATEAQLRYPTNPTDAIEGFLIQADAPHPNARSNFYLDAYDGTVLSYVPYAKASPGHRFYFWTLSWHHGAAGGLFTQILLFLGAISLPVLGYAGIANYLKRRFKRKKQDGRIASSSVKPVKPT